MKSYLCYLSLFWLCALVCSLPLSGKPRTIRVACVGNSVTYGYGLAHPEQDSYPAQLQRLLGQGYEVGNFGKSGATLLRHGHRPYTEQEEYRKAIAFAGDVVVIHLGLNDTDPRNWPNYGDEFVCDYLALIDTLRSANPKARFIIARLSPITPAHPRFESGTREWYTQIQQRIESVAKLSGAQLIDFEAPLHRMPQLLPDALHPTVEGAGLLAHCVHAAITGHYGGLQMPPIYTDGMVLQRGHSIRISGTADSGAEVLVRLAGQSRRARAGVDGRWSVALDSVATGGPYTLDIITKGRELHYHDVLVGEVWLASGQSNMAYTQRLFGEVDSLHQRRSRGREVSPIKLFDMRERWQTSDIKWQASALDSVDRLLYYAPARWQSIEDKDGDFSAVASAFALELSDSLRVPVGIVCNAIGGATLEAWIDRSTLEDNIPALYRDWYHSDYIMPWVRERAATNTALGVGSARRHPYQPSYLFETGIESLDRYPIRGVIWYQGESNAHNIELFERMFPLLIDSWRSYWQDPSLPIYYVQLSSLGKPSWPAMRDAQRRLEGCRAQLGMVVSSDHGHPTDVHPHEKYPIGYRLAVLALAHTYHHTLHDYHSPLPHSAIVDSVEKHSVLLSWDHAVTGLMSSDGKALRGFELAGEDGYFFPAEVVLVDGAVLRLSSKHVMSPRYARYAWKPYTDANVVNGAGLPASTFRIGIES